MALHQRITAKAYRETLDYAVAVLGSRDFHLFHGIQGRRVDFRMVVSNLLDLGAPIADWRNDPRALDAPISETPARVRPTDLFGSPRGDWAGDVYAGAEVEALRGVRREYEKRLIDWLFAEKSPVPPKSDEHLVGAWLIHHMPTVEEMIDERLAMEIAA